jgi:hypothetical protein
LYTHADPVNGIDPSGNMSIGGIMGIGMTIGALGGGIAGGILAHVKNLQGGAFWTEVGSYALYGAILGGISGGFLGIGYSIGFINSLIGIQYAYTTITAAHLGLYLYNASSSNVNENILGLILLTRWAAASHPIFITTNWLEWGTNSHTFDANKIQHMESSIFDILKSDMNSMRDSVIADGRYAKSVSMDHNANNVLRWIIGSGTLVGEKVDVPARGKYIKWTYIDTIDTRTWNEVISNSQIALNNEAGSNVAHLLEVIVGFYVDQIACASIQFNVVHYEPCP